MQSDARIGDVIGEDEPPLMADFRQAGHSEIDSKPRQRPRQEDDAPLRQAGLPREPVEDRGKENPVVSRHTGGAEQAEVSRQSWVNVLKTSKPKNSRRTLSTASSGFG